MLWKMFKTWCGRVMCTNVSTASVPFIYLLYCWGWIKVVSWKPLETHMDNQWCWKCGNNCRGKMRVLKLFNLLKEAQPSFIEVCQQIQEALHCEALMTKWWTDTITSVWTAKIICFPPIQKKKKTLDKRPIIIQPTPFVFLHLFISRYHVAFGAAEVKMFKNVFVALKHSTPDQSCSNATQTYQIAWPGSAGQSAAAKWSTDPISCNVPWETKIYNITP